MLKCLPILGLLILASCSTGHMMTGDHYSRGSVEMKMNHKIAHVDLGKEDVMVGDKVMFYKYDCRKYESEHMTGNEGCEMKVYGEGKVKKLMGPHYSEVETDGSFKFKRGALIKIKK